MNINPLQPAALPVYAVYAGGIDQAVVQRFFSALTAMKNNRNPPTGELHILFQSFGGVVVDSICLYNALRALDIPLTMYNAGTIQSAGVNVYLGAQIRKVSANATFMLHGVTGSPQNASAAVLKGFAESYALDDAHTEAIVRSHTKFTNGQWRKIKDGGLWLNAEDALKAELATEIGEFSSPLGQPWYTI